MTIVTIADEIRGCLAAVQADANNLESLDGPAAQDARERLLAAVTDLQGAAAEIAEEVAG